MNCSGESCHEKCRNSSVVRYRMIIELPTARLGDMLLYAGNVGDQQRAMEYHIFLQPSA